MRISPICGYNLKPNYQTNKQRQLQNLRQTPPETQGDSVSFQGKRTYTKAFAGIFGTAGALGAVGGMLLMGGGVVLGIAALYTGVSAAMGALIGHELDKTPDNTDK